MTNLLKVMLVPEGTTLPSNRADITVLTTKDIINTNGVGGGGDDVNSSSEIMR